jgi:hypothetical protein
MKTAIACAAGLLACAPAHAQDVKFTPGAEVRLRYEHADQAGLPRDADAVTLRVRPSVTATLDRWSALVESEALVALTRSYNDGTNGKTAYPLVADPENLELNRAQLRYAGDATAFTAGRQRVALADERFVGTAPWRQSEQTFDAARVQLGKPQGLSTDVTYSWNVRTVNGRNGAGARPSDIGGDNLFALINYGTHIGTLTGFAYLIDQDEPAVQGFRLSNQTYGVRFAGSMPIGRDMKLGYASSLARQSDWHRNPNDYAATYWLGEATLTAHALTATAGYEVLGADRGVALTSVQTPLASAFKFNGWASKFATTPPNGLRDLYGTLGYGWKQAGPFDVVTLTAVWHQFDSDRLDQHHGNELDLLAGIKRGHYALSARYAHYKADAFATDTDKFWLQLDWNL